MILNFTSRGLIAYFVLLIFTCNGQSANINFLNPTNSDTKTANAKASLACNLTIVCPPPIIREMGCGSIFDYILEDHGNYVIRKAKITSINNYDDFNYSIPLGFATYSSSLTEYLTAGGTVQGDCAIASVVYDYEKLSNGNYNIIWKLIDVEGNVYNCNQPINLLSYAPSYFNLEQQSEECFTDGSYTVKVVFSGSYAPFEAVGSGAPGFFVNNNDGTYTWTSDNIYGSGGYNTTISSINYWCLNSLDITGNTPVCTLPIDLIQFSGKKFENAINLTWKTANESNFSHFEVLKSTNAKEFGSIGTLKSSGKSFYNYLDNQPNEGLNYYQLKMVDLDGSSKLSKVISVNFEKDESFISVENPAVNGEFKVFTNLKNPKFTLLNSAGKQINTETTSLANNTFSIKSINKIAGVYFLNIISEGKSVTKKVLMP